MQLGLQHSTMSETYSGASKLDPLSQDAVSLSQGHQGTSTPYIEDKLTPPEPWGIMGNPYNGYTGYI